MALKPVLETLEGVAEEIQKEYEERDDGKFYLKIDGETVGEAEFKAKIDEFRTNNVKLMKDMEKLTADLKKFEGVDPAKYKQALEKLQSIDDQKLIEEGKITELLATQTERMRGDYEAQIAALKESNAEGKEKFASLEGKFAAAMIDNTIQIAVNSIPHKIREGVMEDIIARGRRVFKMDEERRPVARDASGSPLFGKDGTTPLSIQEWVEELPKNASHFFEPSSGGGSGGGAGAGGGGGSGVRKEDLSKLPPAERLKYLHREREKAAGRGAS
jgi:DNA-directed RNA polymerase subunit F